MDTGNFDDTFFNHFFMIYLLLLSNEETILQVFTSNTEANASELLEHVTWTMVLLVDPKFQPHTSVLSVAKGLNDFNHYIWIVTHIKHTHTHL